MRSYGLTRFGRGARSESIAVGSERFVQGVLHKLEIRAKGRKVREGDDRYELREPGAAYNALFTPENGLLRVEKVFYWNELFEQSIP